MYSENAGVTAQPGVVQLTKLKSLLFVTVGGGIHESSMLSISELLILDLLIVSDPWLLAVLRDISYM